MLLLRWEDDNLGVETEIRRLGNVFSDLYRFDVQYFNIPRVTRQNDDSTDILIEGSGTDGLVIMYYAGHGGLSRVANGPAIWAA